MFGIFYREGYRLLRKSLREIGSQSSTNSPTADNSAGDSHQEILDNPQISDDGSTVDTPAQLTAVLQQMDPYEFEHFVADIWERMGWETEVSSASADKGVAVIARKSRPYDQLVLIQAKRYGPNSTVGSPDVQQYASLRQQYDGVDKVLIVTTNGYSRQAREIAKDLNVKLIDGDGLVELIEEYDSLDLVAEYLDFIEPAESADQSNSDASEPSGGESPTETEVATPDEASTDSESLTPETEPSTQWRNTILGTSVGWLVVFFGVTALPEELWSVPFVGTWLGVADGNLPRYSCCGRVHRMAEVWLAHIVSSLVWFVSIIPGLVYLWRRCSPVDAGN